MRAARVKEALFVTIAIVATAGGCTVKNARTSSPNYSTTPCAENCGTDPTCNSTCTPTSNTNPPVGNMGTGH